MLRPREDTQGLWGPLFRAFRPRDDRASGAVVSMVIGTAVFVVSTSLLVHFVVEPPGTDQGLQDQSLRNRGAEAMQVLLGTTGYPSTWGTSPNVMNRIGLLQQGASSIIDATKFDALARGRLTTDPFNGYVDYGEARTALDLGGYDFHFRASPAGSAFDEGSYGIEGMEAFHVGYVGRWEGAVESAQSAAESATLADLAIKFDNTVRTLPELAGDKFADDSQSLRSVLVPLLGSHPVSTALPDDHVTGQQGEMRLFTTLDAANYSSIFAAGTTLTHALALTNGTVDDGAADLNYTKDKDVRVTLGSANMAGLVAATLTWKEVVDTNEVGAVDDGDYGWVEVSTDGGASWIQVSNTDALRSKDTGQAPFSWSARTIVISGANCAPCVGASEVQVAFHWHADGDDPRGHGWLIDDVSLAPTTTTGFSRSFEKPDLDMLVIGSEVGQNAFTAAEVKYAIRDFVMEYGGRILVLGGETNTQWLQPLFHAGIKDTSKGISTPDTTHPLLGVPNELSYEGYDHDDKVWTFNGGSDSDLFTTVVGEDEENAVLTVSNMGAFGDPGSDGAVILTTYLPYAMPGDEDHRFFANALTYGRYHFLYVDFGPPVPDGVSVASVTRTATMDKTKAELGSFVEMSFVFYIWPGGSPIATASTGGPSAPLALNATPGATNVQLNWTVPSSPGASAITGYNVYMGTIPGAESLATTTAGTLVTINGLSQGTTYYFLVSAVSAIGEGSFSNPASATPSTTPGAPTNPSAGEGPGVTYLTWSQPLSSGGLALTSYNVYRNETDGATLQLLASVPGSNLSFNDANVVSGQQYTYAISATNALGEGPKSASTTASVLSLVPGAPVLGAPVATTDTITLSWTPPTNPGLTEIGWYHVYYGATSPPTQLLQNVSATPTTYQHTGLGMGETYYYRVSAVNGQGEGAYSDVVSATTAALPGQPLALTVSNASMGPQNLSLNWTAPLPLPGATVDGYKIYRGTSPGAEVYLATIGTNTSYADRNGLAHNTTYYYQVRAFSNAAGDGALSDEAQGTTFGPPYPPLVTATPASGHKMTITITAPTYTGGLPVTNYKVYRCEGVGCSPTTYLGETGGATVYTDTGLTALTSYTYQVTAVNAVGEGAKSLAATAVAT